MPPEGEAFDSYSGGPLISSLPRNSAIALPSALGHRNESCSAAVLPVHRLETVRVVRSAALDCPVLQRRGHRIRCREIKGGSAARDRRAATHGEIGFGASCCALSLNARLPNKSAALRGRGTTHVPRSWTTRGCFLDGFRKSCGFRRWRARPFYCWCGWCEGLRARNTAATTNYAQKEGTVCNPAACISEMPWAFVQHRTSFVPH